MSQIDDFLDGKAATPATPKVSAIDAFLGPEKDATLGERVGFGFKRAVSATQTALTDDPTKIAKQVAQTAADAPRQSAAAAQMQADIKPYVEAANKAEGVVDTVKGYGILAAKRAGQLLSNPGEAGKMIAEQLPNSLPGMAGGIAGAKGGAALGSVFGPVGTAAGAVIGGVAGGLAGGYLTEKGSSVQEQVQKKAQEAGVNIQDQRAVSELVRTNQPEIDSAAALKGLGTAGTDVVLNVLTVGLSGMGRRMLGNEIGALAGAVKAGQVTATDAAKQLAALEAKAIAQGSWKQVLGRGAAVTTAEMLGEGASEAVGQKLAYGSVDAGEVVDESLLGLGQGVGMAAASGAYNKLAGTPDQDSNLQRIEALRNAIGTPGADPNAGAAPVPPAGGQPAANPVIEQLTQTVAPLGIVPDPAAPLNPLLPKLDAWTDLNLRLTVEHQLKKGPQVNKPLVQGLANEIARRALVPQADPEAAPVDAAAPTIAPADVPDAGAQFVNPASLTGNDAGSLLGGQGAGLTGGADPLRTALKPSEAMGLNPATGLLSTAATIAVDGPAAATVAAAAQAQAAQDAAGKTKKGDANVSNADAPGAVAAGTGGPVGVDAAGGQPDAGLLGLDGGRAGAGTAGTPAPSVQEGDAAPVPGRDSDKALTKGPTQTKAKVGGLKELIARNKAAKSNVQDQPQGTAPAAAPSPAEAIQAPQAVGSDGAAQPGAAPAGNPGVEAAGVSAPALAKREDGTLKNKSEYTADEWSAYTKSVIDAKLGQQAATPSPTTTEPTNGTQAAQAVEAETQGQQAPAADAAVTEPPDAGQDEAGANWNRMTTVEREAVALRTGIKGVAAKNVATRGWQGLDRVVQERLAKAMANPKAPAPGAALQSAMAAEGWTAEDGTADNVIWTKRANGETYTARMTGASSMEVTVLVNGVGTQIGSTTTTDPKAAAKAASKAVADDVADSAAPAPASTPDPAVREKLMAIAKRLGVAVNTANGGFKAGGGTVDIPAEDAQVEGALSPNHVAAHELAHAAMQKRGISFQGHPIGKIKESFIPNWDALVAASKAFRPAVWSSENQRIKDHARKPNEVIADAIGSVYLGLNSLSLLEPMMKGTGTTEFDLGLKDAPAAPAPTPVPDPVSLGGKKADDMLEMGNGTMYRIVGIEGGRIKLTRNPDMLSERTVLVGQDEYNKLLADHEQTMAEAKAKTPASAPAPAPAPNADGSTIVGRRKDGVMIRKDKNGVRFYTDGGVRVSETVELRQTRQGMQMAKGELKPDFMTAEEAAEAQAAKAPASAPAQENPSMVEFLKAPTEARKELPAGFEIQPEGKTIALKEDGRFAVTGISRTAAGVQEALRQAKLRAEQKAGEKAPKPVTVMPAGAGATAIVIDPGATRAQADPDAAAKAKAQADLDAALGDLGDIFGKNVRASITPEQEQKLLPVLTRVMDAAFRLGYYKFKDAARFVIDTIRSKMGNDVADQITLDHLQGAYIGMAGKYQGQGASTKKEVVAVDSLADLNTAAKPSLYTAEGRAAIAQMVADHLIGDGKFASINDARKFITEKTGEGIPPGTKQAKMADETVELGVVMAAREIVQAARKQGRSDETIFDRLVNLYNAQPNLAVRDSTSIRNQAYSTPVPMAFVASRLAGIKPGMKVGELTAGNGALMIEVDPKDAVVNELNPDRMEALRSQGFNPTNEDATTLKVPAKSLDAINMNPPFGALDGKRWDIGGLETGEIDHAIVMKSLEALKDDGSAVFIIGGVNARETEARRQAYRGKAKREFFATLYGAYNVVDHFTLDGGMYSRQGAGFPVDVLVIRGRGKSKRMLPAATPPKFIENYDQLKEKLNEDYGGVEPAGVAPGVGSDSGAAGGKPDNGLVSEPSGGAPGRPVRGSRPDGQAGGNGTSDGGRADLGAAGPAGNAAGAANSAEPGSAGNPQPQTEARTSEGRANGQEQRQGSGTRPAGNQPAGVGDAAAAKRATDKQGVNEAAEAGKLQVKYESFSQNKSVNTLVATNHLTAIENAFQNLRARVGDVDAFVRKELDYEPEQFKKAFSAEQVEALALAIDNIRQGKGFIIGDQTGIGKGRVVAAMIRYAKLNGKTPVFVTQMPDLYGDMMRDLNDIGMGNMRPLMTNNNASVPLDGEALAWFGEVQAIKSKVDELTDEVNNILREENADSFKGMDQKDVDKELRNLAKISTNPEVVSLRQEIAEQNESKPAKRGKFLDTPNIEAHEKMLADMVNADNIGDYDVIFTTYTQMDPLDSGRPKKDKTTGQKTPKAPPKFGYRDTFLTHFINNNAMLILDESHNAGAKGDGKFPSRGDIVRKFITNSGSVFYSSATFAKNPEVMDAYSKTDLGKAFGNSEELTETVSNVPIQQVTSTMLVEAGQYLRRERSFDGIEYDSGTVEVDQQAAEDVSTAMRLIVAFDKAKKGAIKDIQNDLDQEGAAISSTDGGASMASVDSVNFTSVMHNVINTFLLALKSDAAADAAVQAIRNGEKPVLTVANTMEMFINEYAKEAGLTIGDKLDATFADVLKRYLEKTRYAMIRRPGGAADERVYLTDEQLGPDGLEAYNLALEFIEDMELNIPLSPIDHIKSKIEEAGFSIGEITGRQTVVVGGVLRQRNKAEMNTAGKKNTIAKFNNGQLDALIINRSGSTGLSMHASETFADQRRRVMVIAQAELDINNHMQMLGRVNRTGQVTANGKSPAANAMFGLPRYVQLSANVPIEMRPAAVLANKMANLNANTTAGRKSAVEAKNVPDFMNKYGDRVAAELVGTNPELNERLGYPLKPNDDGEIVSDGAMAKVTGRIGLLPLKQQSELYEALASEYQDLIAQLEALGQNELEAKTYPLDAKTLEKRQVMKADAGPQSPFTQAVFAETVSMRKLGRPYPKAKVQEMVAASLGGKTASDVYRETLTAVQGQIDKEVNNLERQLSTADPKNVGGIEKQITALKAAKVRFREMLPGIGMPYVLKTENGNIYGVVTAIEKKGKAKSAGSLSAWKIKFAVVDGARSMTIPMTQLANASDKASANAIEIAPAPEMTVPNAARTGFDTVPVMEAFDRGQTDARENRIMITGNILRGYGALRGRLMNYTDDQGNIRQGILMPADKDMDDIAGRFTPSLKTAQDMIDFLNKGGVLIDKDSVGATLKVTMSGSRIRLETSKTGLGKKLVKEAQSVYFASSGSKMVANLYDEAEFVEFIEGPVAGLRLTMIPNAATVNLLRGDDDADGVAFSRAQAPASGIPVQTAQQIVDAIAQRWDNAPAVVVLADMNDPRVPAAVRQRDAAQRSGGAKGAPEGFFYKGTAYVVAGSLKTPGDVVRVLFHESLGHYGLRGVFGAQLKPILNQIATMRRKDVEAKAAEYGLDMTKESDRLDAAEEVLAVMAQTSPKVGFVQRAIGEIRAWLRKHVPMLRGMALSDNDIVTQYILPARRFVQSGPGGGPRGGGVPAFSRSAADLTAKAKEGVNATIKAMTATSIKQAAGYKATDLMGIALGALGRRQLVEVYGDDLPLEEYNRLAAQMEADKNETGAEADTIANEWGKLPDEAALADLMHDATLAGMDPDKALRNTDNADVYQELRDRFEALSPEAKATYRKARDSYTEHHKKVRQAIKDRIMRSNMDGARKAALVERMDAEFFSAVKGVYFPLARYGKYVVVVKNKDGMVESVNRAETMAEAAALRQSLLRGFPQAQGYDVGKVILNREFVASRDSVGRGFMQELYQALDKQNLDAAQRAELEDTLGQLYLSSLPDVSWAKHGIHRKGTPGFSQDARRAFAQNMFHGSRYLAKLRYSDLMQDELKAMQDHVDKIGNVLPEEDGFNGPRMQRVVDEFYKRHDSLMNPNSHPLSTALTSIGFMFHLGLSPASAMVNLTQTALVALPVMAAKWGFTKTTAALLKASTEATKGRNDITGSLNGDELKAYNEAVRAGVIDVTMAHDLAGIAQGEDAGVMWRIRPAMRAASFLFHHAERFNRQVTFVAAYRLAREAGAEHVAAFEQATKATYDGHFDYGACVDDSTEILTATGWKKRADLKVGDVAIATDASGRAVESKVLAVNVYEGDREVIEFKSANRFSMVLTPNHDAVIQSYNSRDKKWQGVRKVRADSLKQSHFILRTPLAPLEKQEGIYGDDFAALLGWIAAEGWYSKYRKTTAATDVRIGQSVTHNPEYVAEIRGILERLGGEFKEYTYQRSRDVLTTFVLRRALGRRIQECLPEKVLTPELVKSMTTSEMQAFLMAFLKGDGTQYESGRAWAVGQKNGANLDLLQAMATMCGMRATLSPVNGNGLAVLYVVPDDTGARSHVRPLEQIRRTEPLVWCPTTEHGTWIARRNGAVFVTGNSNRPRFMQGNAAKVILLFKQYGQNMVYTLARNGYQAVNALDPAERARARRALAGVLASHAMAAGVLGLPMVTTILAAISAAGGDDEPFDAEVALKNMLADTFGTKPAEVMAHGLSRLTPWDISGRVGLDRLILPDIQEGLEGQRLAESAMAAALGPVAGIVVNMLRGLQDIGNGHVLRGIEGMMPAALRGPLASLRLAGEGAMDKTGVPIVDEVSVAGVVGQALGFSPSEVRQAQAGKRAVLSYDSALNERRQELMTQFARGAMKQDQEAMAQAREEIRAFNEKHPQRRITMPQLAQSIRSRQQRINRSEGGVSLPANRRDAMEQGRFADVE